jgi:hypothetical protein
MAIREITALVILISTMSFNLPLMTYRRFHITQAFVDGRRIES